MGFDDIVEEKPSVDSEFVEALKGRLKRSHEFACLVVEELRKLGFSVALHGTEHTYPEFVSDLRRSTDQTSLAIRFAPDGVGSIGVMPQSFYWDAKAGLSVEKLAWEQYQKLASAGNIVILIFGSSIMLPRAWQWGTMGSIQLLHGGKTVERYFTKFPVIDEWIYPRLHPQWNEIQRNNPQASGTPFREVDVTSLYKWETIATKLKREKT